MNRLIMSKDEILARKAEGRRYLAGLSLGEKIARMEKLRERVAPMKAARESRQAAAANGLAADAETAAPAASNTKPDEEPDRLG